MKKDRAKAPARQRKTVIDKGITSVLKEAFPDGVRGMSPDWDASWYWEKHEAIRERLTAVPGSALTHERRPERKPTWNEGSDPDEDPPDFTEPASSYCVFYLELMGKEFHFETETPEIGEDGEETGKIVPGRGSIGCVVAISLLGPFAVVRLDKREIFDDGGYSLPDVEFTVWDLDGGRMDPDTYFEELFLQEGVKALHGLRDAIVGVLEAFQVRTLTEEELSKNVTWLRSDEETIPADSDGRVTVESALFYRQMC